MVGFVVSPGGPGGRCFVYFADPSTGGTPGGDRAVACTSTLFVEPGVPKSSVAANELFKLDLSRDTRANVNWGVLTIDKAVWDLAQGTRERVQQAFLDFLTRLEAIEGKDVLRNTASYLRRLVAAYLPAIFPDSLFFHYGLQARGGDRPRQCVDLLPGMRLRVDYQARQLVPSGTANGDPLLSGYVGSGQSHYWVTEQTGEDGVARVAIEAPLGGTGPFVVPAARGGAGGGVDLGGTARRYLRLCLPLRLTSSDDPGYVGTLHNFTVIGADSLACLERATDAYYRQGLDDGWDADCQDQVSAVYFRGRASIAPEILCRVAGDPTWVPVGTTLRQVAQRIAGPIPRLPNTALKLAMLRQAVAPSPRPPLRPGPSPFTLPAQAPVAFNSPPDPPPVAAGIAEDVYDLPLLAGDDISLQPFRVG